MASTAGLKQENISTVCVLTCLRIWNMNHESFMPILTYFCVSACFYKVVFWDLTVFTDY